MGLKTREQKTYASVISDGTIRVKTTESDPLGVRRDYKLQDGTEGFKFERVYNELSGKITGVSFFEGDYGKQINITVSTEGEDDVILALNLSANYAEDIMKKLPSIDFSKEVVLKPYSFEDDKKKLRKGISVSQDDIKIKSFFHDDKNNPINGFPTLEKDATGQTKQYDKEDWKIYFIQTRKFLVKYLEDNLLEKIDRDNYKDVNIGDGVTIKGKIVDDVTVGGEEVDFNEPEPVDATKAFA